MLTNRHAPPLKPLFHIGVVFEDAQVIGDVPSGGRRVLTTRHGGFNGAFLRGEVLAGGGDWVLHRRDGVADLDIRFTLRTDEDDLIYMSGRGIFDASPEVRQHVRAGNSTEPDAYYFRTTVFFETASQQHQRLNRIVAVGRGTRTPDGMETDVFEVM